jgi:hypothetical protein
MSHSLARASRKLIRTALWAGKFYPVPGYEAVRKIVRTEFDKAKQQKLTDEETKQLIAKGRWMLKELEALNGLHKYRQMKKRYYEMD